MELELVSGEFLDGNLPKDKLYLTKYFTTKVQRVFVKYFVIFGTYDHFAEHTGYPCTLRWLKQLAFRFHQLEAAMKTAKDHGDFEMAARIESGGLRFAKM